MAFDYTDLVEVAEELIEEFGREIRVIQKVRVGGEDYAPIYEDVESDPFFAAQLDFKPSEIDGKNIKVGDKKFVLPGSPVIDTTMRIRDGGIVYDIVPPIVAKQPGDTLLVQFVQCRR